YQKSQGKGYRHRTGLPGVGKCWPMCRDFGAWEVGQRTNYPTQAKTRLELATRRQIAVPGSRNKSPQRTRASVPYPEPALSEAEGLLSKNGREPGPSGGTGTLDIGAIINAGTYLSDRTRVRPCKDRPSRNIGRNCARWLPLSKTPRSSSN